MSNVNEPIRFGDVVKLQTKSAFVESATPACLGFLELPGKAQTQLLVVPPVKDEVKDRFNEAEFIITPIRGEKQQANGTPLTYQTPFVLRTSDGKDGSTYSLNNKVTGQREGISLQVSASKGEMYIQVEKEGCTNAAGLHYGDDGLSLHVVDSNRVRKTLNHVLTHVAKPKSDTPGGLATCGAKGSALTFSFMRAVDAEGKPQTETRKFVKNPQARRTSLDALSPAKMDELGRADRIDSSDSDVDSMSRSSSIAGLSSNPASPRGAGPANAMATPVSAAEVAARLPAAKASTTSSASASANSSSYEMEVKPGDNKTTAAATPASPPKDAATKAKASASPAASPVKPAESPVKTATAPVASPVKTAEPAASPAKAEAGAAKPEAAKKEPTKADTAKAETEKKTEAKTETKPEAAKPMTTATPPPTPIKTDQGEPKTVLADASTFPPMPAISGPAPSPVVVSPKSAASPKSGGAKAGAGTPTGAVPSSPKMLKEEEVAQLKAEAEVEKLEPACGAKCSVM